MPRYPSVLLYSLLAVACEKGAVRAPPQPGDSGSDSVEPADSPVDAAGDSEPDAPEGDSTPPDDSDAEAADPGPGDSDVGDTDAPSEDPPKPVSFVAFGDMGTASDAQRAVADAVKAWCEDHPCDFVITLGDNFYPGGVTGIDDPQFQTKFEVPYAALDYRFYMVLGNHDYLVTGSPDHQVDYTIHSSRWYMPSRYYAFEDSNVAFFALDTMDASTTQRLAQTRAIEASDATWKVVFGHHPLLSASTHGNATGTYKTWVKKILCDRVDFYLSGHDHAMQRMIDQCGVQLYVSGAGGASTYAVTDGPELVFGLAEHGFLYASFEGDTARMRYVDTDGDVVYETTKTRAVETHGCAADAFCDQECSDDPDCAGRTCAEDSTCDLLCSDDPDCWGTCACDYHPGICEAIERNTSEKCGCDPACSGDRPACGDDGHCDTWCPTGADPDC